MTTQPNRTIQEIAALLVSPTKGILAADESKATIDKRFAKLSLPSSLENRRAYRELLFTTPDIEQYLSGAILYNETIRQSTKDGKPFADVLSGRGILPGIKVDLGTEPLPSSTEKVTIGLENLSSRLEEYKELGAVFTKWRAVFDIQDESRPSDYCIAMNSDHLADYAKTVQSVGMVPIVEPEVLMDGDHSIDQCETVTRKVLTKVFTDLKAHNVDLSGILLKPNMVLSGKDSSAQASVEEVAKQTIQLLKETVPSEVPGIVFLSGGQGPIQACEHLQAMNTVTDLPWQLSFSFGRALQDEALTAWAGNSENMADAQALFAHRCQLVSAARSGSYSPSMEK